ncbi:restriction endonuclease subunit S [uncultured Chryseobacterium sp.]|uniref:restriction endonuclease subunit S n=1 Tax=uncultured Chryseobacterium sp. TaxID=259322 RepID=UPI0025F9E3E2|nr:restriction endonuclease subunit S [uncultured Chryseobacterium sp.]
MKPYDTYKDSGIEWIGAIPNHWDSIRLKFLGESIIGIIYSPDDVVNEGEGILVLRSSNIQEGKLAFEDNVFVNKSIQEKHLTKEGDILVCARNGSAHLVGKSAFISKEYERLTFGAFMSIVRSDLRKFLFYFFNSQIFKAQTGLFSTSTINQLTSDTLNNMFISVPSEKKEQIAIATYLDHKTAEIDALIADKKRLLELYEEEKTAIINQAVTKGIDPKAKMKDSGIDWLGEIPERWELKRLRYVCKITTGSKDTENREDDGIYPFFVRSQTIERISTYSYDGEGILTAGDGVGVCKVWHYINGKFDFHQRVYLMYDFVNIQGEFLFYFMRQNFIHDVLKQSAKSTVDSLRRNMFLDFVVAFPEDTKEQQSIVVHIETECTRIDAKIAKTQKLIKLLTEYRTTLISEVVTGKIKVMD